MVLQTGRISGGDQVLKGRVSPFFGPVLEQGTELARRHPTDVLDLDVHLNGIRLAESDARLRSDPRCSIGWLDLDGLLIHTHLVLARDVAGCRICPGEVDDCMFLWVAAVLQSSTARVGANTTEACQ
jgi:hypothetical protein